MTEQTGRDAAGDPVDDPYEIESDIGPDGPVPEPEPEPEDDDAADDDAADDDAADDAGPGSPGGSR